MLKIEPLVGPLAVSIFSFSPRCFCNVCASVKGGPSFSAATSKASRAGVYSTEWISPPPVSSKTRLFKTLSISFRSKRMLIWLFPSTVPSWFSCESPELNITIPLMGGVSTTEYLTGDSAESFSGVSGSWAGKEVANKEIDNRVKNERRIDVRTIACIEGIQLCPWIADR